MPDAEPVPLPEFAAPDSDELAYLVAALQTWDGNRRAKPVAEAGGRRTDILRGSCLTLLVSPAELGHDPGPSAWRDQARVLLLDVGPDDLPEARIGRLWLACTAGEALPDAAGQWEALAGEPLWSPMRALAFRALAHYGRRQALAWLVPLEGPVTLDRADAWLEATHASDCDDNWIARISSADDSLLPSAVREQWAALLAAEAALLSGPASPEAEGKLGGLARIKAPAGPWTYAAVETRRLAARASAALARLRLAQGPTVEQTLPLLPAWERDYLQALGCWQCHEMERAAALLEQSLTRNPWQTCVRLALAGLRAVQSPEAALEVLAHTEPTRELLVASAALLVRLRRFEEAEQALAYPTGLGGQGREPGRYRWARAAAQQQRQELLLRAALAERQGDWHVAGQARLALRATAGAARDDWRSREFFAASRELQALPPGQRWLRGGVQHRLERLQHEIGSRPLAGDELFFRAAAFLDTQPERARADCQTLLRQQAWIEAEQQVGGGRLVAVGDILLRLGHPAEALSAYERATSSQEVQERRAVVLVLAAVARRAGPETLTAAVAQAAELARTSPWPQLLAALGWLLAGQGESALAAVAAAEQYGEEERLCRCLRSLASGGPEAALTEDNLTVLRLPPEIDALFRVCRGSEEETARLAAFVRAFGADWMARCPLEPQAVARRLLAAWCEEENWSEALAFADSLTRSGQAWAADLAVLVRLRHSLARAARGELTEAQQSLQALEAQRLSGPG